ncbi:MAG: DUF3616 domain-containing protein [Gammaproteobacteria bacterium]|nr:DUF3616 domain-containing protein [Gammaproteobacteria bacterium]
MRRTTRASSPAIASSTQARVRRPGLLLLLLALAGVGVSVGVGVAGDTGGFEKFRKFDGIYEPSGVLQLPDGRFVVVQDEASHPLDLFALQADGAVAEQPLFRRSLFSWSSPNRVLNALEDLEGVAIDAQGLIYAVTSHSRKTRGKRANSREQLVRFALDGGQVTGLQVLRGLRKRITARHRLLKDAAKVRDVKDDGGFNIEGLSFDAGKQNLLLGLRSPLAGSNAIIVVLSNPDSAFDGAAKPQVSERLIELDLDGGGIRGMSHDPHLGGFLIISAKPGKAFKLWLWSGDAKDAPRRLRVRGVKNLRQAEGVAPVRLDGRPVGILIVSDDGDGVRGKPGRYLFLRYEQLFKKN